MASMTDTGRGERGRGGLHVLYAGDRQFIPENAPKIKHSQSWKQSYDEQRPACRVCRRGRSCFLGMPIIGCQPPAAYRRLDGGAVELGLCWSLEAQWQSKRSLIGA